MMAGNPGLFAIESGITKAFERMSLRALGFFVVHVGGYRYGVHRPDASMLARSFDAVEDRIARRGKHTASFATDADAGKIAEAFRNALFSDHHGESYLDMPVAEFRKLFETATNDCMWAPDGDEAFDDGSYILQFDVEDRVRLIAFKSSDSGNSYDYDPATLRDTWLAADDFYSILGQWRDAFESEWLAMPKSPEVS